MNTQEIEAAVDRELAETGVTFAVVYRGLKAGALGDKGCTMDKWGTTLTRDAIVESFDCYTGLGLREPASAREKQVAAYGFQGLTEKDKRGLTDYGRRYLKAVEDQRKPKAPSAASVLQSLILDSSAADMSFASWCADLGYDEDSRKAFATYEACQQNADKLRRVLSRAGLIRISELLQDY